MWLLKILILITMQIRPLRYTQVDKVSQRWTHQIPQQKMLVRNYITMETGKILTYYSWWYTTYLWWIYKLLKLNQLDSYALCRLKKKEYMEGLGFMGYTVHTCITLQWCHKRRDSVWNHQPHDCFHLMMSSWNDKKISSRPGTVQMQCIAS